MQMKHKIFLIILVICCNSWIINAQQINVATYNIRNDNAGDVTRGNGWKQRCPVVCQLVQFHDFDIFGSQEVKKNQLDDLLNTMPEYDYIGVMARSESAKLVLERIKSMCGKEPVILMGDFNVDQFNEAYLLLNSSGIMKDVYDITGLKYALNGTFNSFDPNLTTERRIDHIFVSEHFKALRYGVLTDSYRSNVREDSVIKSENFPKEVSLKSSQARMPSDHFPVLTTLEFSGKGNR